MELFILQNAVRIFNHKIYNYKDLLYCLKELKKWTIRTRSTKDNYDDDWCISIPLLKVYLRYSLDKNCYNFSWFYTYVNVEPYKITSFWAVPDKVVKVIFRAIQKHFEIFGK